MPDDLYERDILAWSEQQAALLQRLARGERVNDAIDWPNLIEEVQDVGLSELHGCEGLLQQALLHLLKLHLQPDSLAAAQWRSEIVGFLSNAARRFAPSMRRRIDLNDEWRSAVRQIVADRGRRPPGLPDSCPFGLEDLLAEDADPATLAVRIG